ncbi:2OG-Fe(II) oxygenase [Acetobacter persici]|uniref:2OG-Fe(II) oxygenase n=1 Tax=Acetobacter persici TaxID=1076596 RepID=UPI0020CDE7CA|nr:2OG-Fe(II) oxygenase [Acetobacter persici]MCP9319578.1 2OG-Fe(II) oxygenase [Acetobacter persici]
MHQPASYIGDPVAPFTQRASTPAGSHTFDMSGGRFNLLLFCNTLNTPTITDTLNAIQANPPPAGSPNCSVFIVCSGTINRTDADLQKHYPHCVFFFDRDLKVHKLFGISPNEPPQWVIVNPMLHVADRMPHTLQIWPTLHTWICQQQAVPLGMDCPVPALVLPHILEPEFCAALIHYYQTHDAQPSPILFADRDGNPQRIIAPDFKRRHDCFLRDKHLVEGLQARVIRRAVPAIFKVFRFQASRMERLLISLYHAEDQGFFAPHRDNTVSSSAHRQFAISINLNSDFDGGRLFFPEFSLQEFSAPAGGGIIFSCSLLHAVTPVTRGTRYACLPFIS